MQRHFGRATVAVVRAIDPSLADAALRLTPSGKVPETVCLDTASQQHSELVHILKTRCSLDRVLTLPSGGFPDSVFIEDTAVAIGSRVLITVPGAESRRGETKAVLSGLRNSIGGTSVVHMKHLDEEATLDGGDVLFTGAEVFVGISNRTNSSGAAALQLAFPEIPVRAIDIQQFGDSCLHLK